MQTLEKNSQKETLTRIWRRHKSRIEVANQKWLPRLADVLSTISVPKLLDAVVMLA